MAKSKSIYQVQYSSPAYDKGWNGIDCYSMETAQAVERELKAQGRKSVVIVQIA